SSASWRSVRSPASSRAARPTASPQPRCSGTPPSPSTRSSTTPSTSPSRTRMLTTGFKLYMGLFVAAFASAVAFGYTTGGNHLGPLTVGYKGAVGDHVGYGVLITISALFLALALLYVAFRDADARAAAELL